MLRMAASLNAIGQLWDYEREASRDPSCSRKQLSDYF